MKGVTLARAAHAMIKVMLAFIRDVLIEKNEVVTNCDHFALRTPGIVR